MQIREGDRIFQGGPNNSEILVLGSKNFSKIKIIILSGGPSISIYLNRVKLNKGSTFCMTGPLATVQGLTTPFNFNKYLLKLKRCC